MSINRFYTDVLGADLRNTRWSWGSFDPVTNRLYLRVWQHEIRTIDEVPQILVLRRVARSNSPGYAERIRHLDLMRDGAEGYGVVCTAVDPEAPGAREIATFDDQSLLKFGSLVEYDDGIYAAIVDQISADDLARPQTAATTLGADLKSILRAPLEATEKEALLSARIGQGAFRRAVLARWGGRCAVSGVTMLDVIRASHIKPWRAATNEERLDPANGLPLAATLDALFDAGLISFQSDGTMLISPRIPPREREVLDLPGLRLLRVPHARTAAYLMFHRETIFVG